METGLTRRTRANSCLIIINQDMNSRSYQQKHPPTTKSEHHFVGIEFGFLHFRPDKSVRIELERFIVYRRIVEHFPMNGHKQGLDKVFNVIHVPIPNVGQNQGTLGDEVTRLNKILGNAMRNA